MNKILRVLLGFCVSAGCLWFVFRGFKMAELRSAFDGAAYLWMLPLTFFFFFNYILRTFRWMVFLSPLTTFTLPTLFPILVSGFFLNNVLPARAGEFLRAAAAARHGKISGSAALGSVVAERLSDFVGMLFIMSIASILIPWKDLPVVPVALVLGGLSAAVLLFVLFVNKFRMLAETGPLLLRKILKFVFLIPEGFKSLKSGRKIAAVLFLSVCIWSSEALQLWLMSRVTHMNLSFVECACLLVGLSVGVMIPAAPGFIGTYEFFGKEVLVKLGYAAAPSLSMILALHFFQIIMITLVGLPCLLKIAPKTEPAA